MWILTQNGERILSTESLDEIRVADPAPGRSDYAVMINRRTDGKGFALGFYRKKEKAITVLQEIIKTQGSWYKCEGGSSPITGYYQQAFALIPPKTYTMPTDER